MNFIFLNCIIFGNGKTLYRGIEASPRPPSSYVASLTPNVTTVFRNRAFQEVK